MTEEEQRLVTRRKMVTEEGQRAKDEVRARLKKWAGLVCPRDTQAADQQVSHELGVMLLEFQQVKLDEIAEVMRKGTPNRSRYKGWEKQVLRLCDHHEEAV